MNGRTGGIRPRHCMVVHAYYPLHEPRVSREAEALVRAGYDVDVVCLRDEGQPAYERHQGVDVHRLAVQIDKRSLGHQFLSYTNFLARATAHLTRVHRRDPYRTVQVHNLPDFLAFCALAPKLSGTPVLLDLHDLMPEFFSGRFGTGAKRPLAAMVRAQERWSCRFADHVITVSDAWRDRLVSRGVAPERCSVVMNVADDRVFGPRPRRPATAPGFRLIYHGQLTHRYGLDLAIRAVDALRDEIPGLHLTIHGRGDAVDELAALIRERALESVVELSTDSVPAEELPDMIADADLGVVPYRDDVFTDGIVPTKLMEYAAVGIPCVAARTTAISTYFTSTMTELFTPGDVDDLAAKIRELHADRQRLDELADGSRRFKDRYRWAQVQADYVALVTRLGTGGTAAPVTSSPLGSPAATRSPRRDHRRGRTRTGVRATSMP
jgi:glycosyltransferase involved in cell wall biosynthesis